MNKESILTGTQESLDRLPKEANDTLVSITFLITNKKPLMFALGGKDISNATLSAIGTLYANYFENIGVATREFIDEIAELEKEGVH